MNSRIDILIDYSNRNVLLFRVIFLAALMIIPFFLQPNINGYGTHTQLGIHRCPLFTFFGIKCPTCGLTTSFSLIAKGELKQSIKIHPLGIPIYLCVIMVLLNSILALCKKDFVISYAQEILFTRSIFFALIVTWILKSVLAHLHYL